MHPRLGALRRPDPPTRIERTPSRARPRSRATAAWWVLATTWAVVSSDAVFGSTAERANRTGADVVSIEVSGDPGGYTFSVGILSPDTGCDQYADWWEVVSLDGELVHRNTLLHSHVDEQPFVRASGPVEIGPDTEVWIRAHMFPSGYGGRVLRGTVASGFRPASPPSTFAIDLENDPPQPPDCAF